MRAVAQHGHAHRIDGGVGGHGVAFDAWDLHQATDRIAGQAKIVFDANLRGILHLMRSAAHHRAQSRSRHGTGCADLALASDLRAGDRRVAFEQISDRPRRQQEFHHAILTRMIHEMPVVVEDRGNDSRGAIGRCCDDASAGRVFLGYRQSEQVDPCGIRRFKHSVRAFPVAFEHIAIGCEPGVHPGRSTWHVQTAGKDLPARAATVPHATAHHTPDVVQFAAHLHGRAHGRLIRPHHIGDAHMMFIAQRNQLIACGERIGSIRFGQGIVIPVDERGPLERFLMNADHRIIGGSPPYETASDRIPDLLVDEIVLPIECLEPHSIGMSRHTVPRVHHHIAVIIETDAMGSGEHQFAILLAFVADDAHMLGIDSFRDITFHPRQHGTVGAMSQTRQGERTVQHRPHTTDPVQHAIAFEGIRETACRDHRSDGMRRTRADADGEHLQNAEHIPLPRKATPGYAA